MTASQQDRLQQFLRQQLGFLQRSSRLFDDGEFDEAIRLGVVIRVLMHQTSSSHALLEQLGLRASTQYVDTCLYRDDVNEAKRIQIEQLYGPDSEVVSVPNPGEVGLVDLADPDTNGDVAFVPILANRGSSRTSPLDRWWTAPAIETSGGSTYSRKQLVLVMANKDGGAHVDPQADLQYEDFKIDDLGVQYTEVPADWVKGDPTPAFRSPSGNVANASMRQIAWEMEQTLLNLGLPWL